jgi:hypothetical protein
MQLGGELLRKEKRRKMRRYIHDESNQEELSSRKRKSPDAA